MTASYGQTAVPRARDSGPAPRLSRPPRDSAGQSSAICRLTSAFGCPALSRDSTGQRGTASLSPRVCPHKGTHAGTRPGQPTEPVSL